MAVIAIPRTLREKLGDDGSEALAQLMNEMGDSAKKDNIAFLEEKFERRLAEVKADIIKWMFIFWVGQIGVLTGILFAFFK